MSKITHPPSKHSLNGKWIQILVSTSNPPLIYRYTSQYIPELISNNSLKSLCACEKKNPLEDADDIYVPTNMR
jgi:hypothetical protein